VRYRTLVLFAQQPKAMDTEAVSRRRTLTAEQPGASSCPTAQECIRGRSLYCIEMCPRGYADEGAVIDAFFICFRCHLEFLWSQSGKASNTDK
jgi:hypothetical protein